MNSTPDLASTETATTPNSTNTTIVSSNDPIVSLTLPVAIKLNESNFLTWKSQILPLIYGYDLSKFLESSPPEKTRLTVSGHLEFNPSYLSWRRQDQLLLGWLRSSLTEPLLAQVVSSTSAREFWTALEDYFSSTSRARLNDLKHQIQTAQKGDLSCSEYLLHLHRVADELAFIGSPLPEEDLVTATINGLGTEYNAIVAALATARCHGVFSFSDLRGLLLSHEALLKTQTTSHSSAFYAGRGGSSRYRPPSYSQSASHHRPRDSTTSISQYSTKPHTGPFTGSLPSQHETLLDSSSHSFSISASRPICQICSKIGHNAKLCFRRYDKDNEWKPNSRFKAYNVHALPQNHDSTN
jgi:gag-polypeptide of LTR copia-type